MRIVTKKTTHTIEHRHNISAQRRWKLIFARIEIITKIALIAIIYILCYTTHLDRLTNYLAEPVSDFAADLGFSLATVIIEGNINIPTETIVNNLNADVGTPLFSLPLKELHEKLRTNSWVSNAIIQRRWPSSLFIHIEEKTPIAIWQNHQNLYLIDKDGEIIDSKNIEKFASLLHVVSTDANLFAAELKADLSSCPELMANVVSAVRFGGRRWNLHLKQNIIIKMPENNFAGAWQYLTKLHKAGKLFDQNLKMLDLRDPTKYYVEVVPTQLKMNK